MKNLARSLVDLYYELNFVEEDYVDFEWSLRSCANILDSIQNDFSDQEKSAIQSAAANKLKDILREPDEHGYTPRSLVSEDQRSFLIAVSEGRFDGAPAD